VFSVIATENSINAIKSCLDTVSYEKVGEFVDNEIISILSEVSRINTDILIIDIKSCYNDGIILGLRQYRTIRSKTRIIVIAPNTVPGNPYISSIVKLGIYDIITPNIEDDEEYMSVIPYLTELLSKEPLSYSDVARWDTQNEIVNLKKKSSKKVIEKKVIEKKVVEKIVEKPVYINKVKTEIITKEVISNHIISVLGGRLNGSSFLVDVLAQAFAKRKYTVTIINFFDISTNCYLNLQEENVENVMKSMKNDKYEDVFNNCFQIENLNIISLDASIETDKFNKLLNFSKGKSDVVIVDCGKRKDIIEISILNSSLNLYVFDLSPYKLIKDVEQLRVLKEENAMGNNSIAIVNKYEECNSKCYEWLQCKLKDINVDRILKIRYIDKLNDCILENNLWSYENIDNKFKQDINVLMEKIKAREELNENKKVSSLTNTLALFLLFIFNKKFIYTIIMIIVIIMVFRHFNFDINTITKLINMKGE